MPQTKILVIEDNPRMRVLLAMLLVKEGYEVLEAGDGAVGFEKARQVKPDLVILDLKLPGMSGEEVCSSIRKDPNLAYTPILMLSVKAHISEKLAGFRLGADDYLTKPFDTQELVARVKMHLRRSLRERMYNPRTLLPSRSHVLESMEQRFLRDEAFAVLRIDIDSFFAFNRSYGLSAGDGVLALLADAIVEASGDSGDQEAFAGHLGEDDFIVVCGLESAKSICQGVIDRFETRVPAKYSQEDRKRGYLIVRDRRGNESKVSLLTISIGIAMRPTGGIDNAVELMSVAAEMLKYCKTLPGSNYFADRRTRLNESMENSDRNPLDRVSVSSWPVTG